MFTKKVKSRIFFLSVSIVLAVLIIFTILRSLEDLKKEIIVSYNGLLPNLFAEDKGVIAEGKLRDKKYLIANKILAKHDENYMPPEVSKALEKQDN